MYNTGYERMCCILDGYAGILRAYNRDLMIAIDNRYYLAKTHPRIYLKPIPESLHNFKSEPAKAYQIISRLKHVLKSSSNRKENISYLVTLLRQDFLCNYQNDPDALQFAESVISRIIELAMDDNQFSEFSYF
jgi:hypothetical protein